MPYPRKQETDCCGATLGATRGYRFENNAIRQYVRDLRGLFDCLPADDRGMEVFLA